MSVVVPAHDAAPVLRRCLEAIASSQGVAFECIVVDDASNDATGEIARAWGARTLGTGNRPVGPGQARNLGAHAARAPLVCFVDADVVVRRDTLAQMVALFDEDPGLAAAFGSYDDQPHAPGVLSQYRNLLHHFVHQHARDEASTFWAGCGAVRRQLFLSLGGFDPAYDRPSIEDIELGYRIVASGHRIRLAKHVQVTHLKRWTFWGILKTDVRDRAAPWTALIQRTGRAPNDLNLDRASRISALSFYALLGSPVLAAFSPFAWVLAATALVALVLCNWALYHFFWERRGAAFLLAAVPMHWLYFGYSALAFGCVTLWLRAPRPGVLAPARPAAASARAATRGERGA